MTIHAFERKKVKAGIKARFRNEKGAFMAIECVTTLMGDYAC